MPHLCKLQIHKNSIHWHFRSNENVTIKYWKRKKKWERNNQTIIADIIFKMNGSKKKLRQFKIQNKMWKLTTVVISIIVATNKNHKKTLEKQKKYEQNEK